MKKMNSVPAQTSTTLSSDRKCLASGDLRIIQFRTALSDLLFEFLLNFFSHIQSVLLFGGVIFTLSLQIMQTK